MESTTVSAIKDNFPELVEGQTTEEWVRAYLEAVQKVDPGLEADLIEVCQEVANSEEEEKVEIDATGLDELEVSPEKDRIEVNTRIAAVINKFMREAFSILETSEKQAADLQVSLNEKEEGAKEELKEESQTSAKQEEEETKENKPQNPEAVLQQQEDEVSQETLLGEDLERLSLEQPDPEQIQHELNSKIAKMKVITEEMPAILKHKLEAIKHIGFALAQIQWICIIGDGTDLPDPEYYTFKPLYAYKLKIKWFYTKIHLSSEAPPPGSQIVSLKGLKEIHRTWNDFPKEEEQLLVTDLQLQSEELKSIQGEWSRSRFSNEESLICNLGNRVIVDFKETRKSAYVGLVDQYYCV